MCMHESRGISREAGIAVDKVLPIRSFTSVQGRRNTFKTRGAEDSRYIRGRFASEASENFFEVN